MASRGTCAVCRRSEALALMRYRAASPLSAREPVILPRGEAWLVFMGLVLLIAIIGFVVWWMWRP